jgi:8-oxo-dGTP pyrophosphatase MutT (NUDIX family)
MKRFSGLIEDVTRLDLKLADVQWAFAQNERARIDAHWQQLVDANSRIWNGDILVAQDVFLGDGLLSARFCVSDYASYVSWRDWGWPDKKAFNIFGMPALRTSDNVLIFAEMAEHTLNGGKVYPPGGSLETRDVVNGEIDLIRSMQIEVREETGFDLSTSKRGGAYAIMDGQRIAYMQQYATALTFSEVEQIYAAHVDEHQELKRLVPVRGRKDIADAMPAYARAIVEREFKK